MNKELEQRDCRPSFSYQVLKRIIIDSKLDPIHHYQAIMALNTLTALSDADPVTKLESSNAMKRAFKKMNSTTEPYP